MNIGIGIISYNRPQHLALCVEQIQQHTKDYLLYIADDSKDRKGVAYRSNECLGALKDCDYIFLFNDDCFPIKDGWAEWFIEAHKESENHHFLYLQNTSTIKQIQTFNGPAVCKKYIQSYNNCGGCFLFLTKEVIEKVGGFNKDYGFYGWEHAAYSIRIHNAGLTPMGAFLCPEGAGEYIYSMDYDNHLHYNKMVKHRPSMPTAEMIAEIKKNEANFKKDIEEIYQPL